MRRKVTPQDVKNAYYQKILGVDRARVGCDTTVVGSIDLSEGYDPPRKYVESKEVPWDTPLIEGE